MKWINGQWMRRTVFAAAALWISLAGVSGQPPAVPPAQGLDPFGARSMSLDDLQYINSFEEFVYNPVAKLKYTRPDVPPAPLFEPYDPLVGMSPASATSRIARTDRTVFYLPVVEARVGEEFTLPLVMESGGPVSAFVAWVGYDPAIVEGIRVTTPKDLNWDLTDNLEPDPARPAQGRIVAVQVSLEPKKTPGDLTYFRFKALAPGTTRLSAYQFDASDPTFHSVRCVIRDGMVRVLP